MILGTIIRSTIGYRRSHGDQGCLRLQARRWVRKLRTWLGRLDRDIGRKIAGDPALEAAFAVARERVAKILTQKAGDTDKLYALHAPEVECIAKGKARTHYEFGVKTSIAVTNARTAGGQFIIGMQALPGRPYDGHTLTGQIERLKIGVESSPLR
jgi:IS5 family transposase